MENVTFDVAIAVGADFMVPCITTSDAFAICKRPDGKFVRDVRDHASHIQKTL
jgi:hypothetical protein